MNEMFAAHDLSDADRHPSHARGGLDRHGRRWGALLARIAAGDLDALGTLYDESSSLTFGLVMHMLQDREAAEDALVDVYTQVRDQAGAQGAEGNPVAWLIGLARRTALARLPRSRHLRPPVQCPPCPPVAATSVVPFEPFHRERQQIRRALDQLTPRQRSIVQMTYFGGLGVSDVAGELTLSTEQVRSELRQAMWTLRNALA